MDTETQNPVPAAGQRCWRPCLINRATPSVYWIALSLLFFIAVFASSVTRFAPGSDLSSSGQAVMVVPNPANPNGPPRVAAIVTQ